MAIARAHRRLRAGLGLEIPVLAARAAQGGPETVANPDHMRQDTVVDVEAISRLAPQLRSRVEMLVIEDGIHDLCLSDPAPCAAYLNGVIDFLDRELADGQDDHA